MKMLGSPIIADDNHAEDDAEDDNHAEDDAEDDAEDEDVKITDHSR